MAGLEYGFCLLDAQLATTVITGNELVGGDVIDAGSGVVCPENASGEVAIGKRMGVVLAQDVTAPGKIIVRHAQLAEKSGGNIALVHECLYAFGLTDGTSQPEHGAVEEQGIFIALLVEMAVVWQYDNQ